MACACAHLHPRPHRNTACPAQFFTWNVLESTEALLSKDYVKRAAQGARHPSLWACHLQYGAKPCFRKPSPDSPHPSPNPMLRIYRPPKTHLLRCPTAPPGGHPSSLQLAINLTCSTTVVFMVAFGWKTVTAFTQVIRFRNLT